LKVRSTFEYSKEEKGESLVTPCSVKYSKEEKGDTPCSEKLWKQQPRADELIKKASHFITQGDNNPPCTVNGALLAASPTAPALDDAAPSPRAPAAPPAGFHAAPPTAHPVQPYLLVPLVNPGDKSDATNCFFYLISQMERCEYQETDRHSKRNLQLGFAGLACRHCAHCHSFGLGSGRFFPAKRETLADTSKTFESAYNHIMKCNFCPTDVKEMLERRCSVPVTRREKYGVQKAFVDRIWDRLHTGTGVGKG
jgi:hypothetical protein